MSELIHYYADVRLRLILRALRWRLGSSVSLLVVATVAILAATAGPLYFATSVGTVLHATLKETSPFDAGLTANPSPADGNQKPLAQAAARVGQRHFRLGRWYGKPFITYDAGASLPHPGAPAPFGTDLIARAGVCSHLHFVSGSCPAAPNQVAITTRDAAALHAGLGSLLPVTTLGAHAQSEINGVPVAGAPLMMKVSGVISVGNYRNPYWLGSNFFDFGPAPQNPHAKQPLDAFFTGFGTLAPLPYTAMTQFPLRASTVNIGNVGLFRSTEQAYRTWMLTHYNVAVSTGVNSRLDSVNNQTGLMQAIVVVVDLQLVLLALFVLYGLVARTAEARQREVALSKLHGFRGEAVLLTALLEPALIILLALPLGVGLAWLLARLLSVLLLGNVTVIWYPLAAWAALAAFGGGLLAAVVGARRIIARRLLNELQPGEPKSSPAARAAMDAAAVALAVAGIVELVASGVLNGRHPNSLALFAPGLVAVAVAVLGVRLLPVLCAVVVSRTRNSHFLATALAVRQVVRRPTTLRQILVLAVAIGLGCFAVTGWAVAGANRVARADFLTGAARVLDVSYPDSVNLVTAVDRADPSGRWAMPVMVSYSPQQVLLGVQASRLARVAYWPAGVSSHGLAQIVKRLEGHAPPPLQLFGAQVEMTVSLGQAVDPEPDLQFSILGGNGQPGVVDFGYLRPGTHTYQAPLPSLCNQGCEVTALVPYWSAISGGPTEQAYRLAISNLRQRAGAASPWRPASTRASAASYWKPGEGGGATVVGNVGGTVQFAFNDNIDQLQAPQVVPGPLPFTLPGVVTAASQVVDPAAATVEDFDGTPLTLNTEMQVGALPEVGASGYLLSLNTALHALQGPALTTQSQVWLAPHTPARVLRALRREGLQVRSQTTPATLLSQLNHGGLALSYEFFLVAAGAAALLAIGAAVFSVFMASRRRAYELAVLRAIGVSHRTLLRSLLGEQLLVLGPGTLLGVIAGIVGAVLALPSVPEFAKLSGGPAVQLFLPVVPIVALIAALVVLLAVAASAAAVGTLRMASYQRLRMEIG